MSGYCFKFTFYKRMRFLSIFCVFLSCAYAALVGQGKSDVTGPIADVGLMGYADPGQLGSGLLMRLFCRSFFFVSDANEHVLIIHTDLHSISLRLREEVVRSLIAKSYTDSRGNEIRLEPRNVVLHAQHTHSGPGGYHPSVLYYLTIFGFTEEHFHFLHKKIVRSAEQALSPENQFQARLFLSQHKLLQTGRNRSPGPFFKNPEEEVAAYIKKYGETKNTIMTIVRIEDEQKTNRGILSFFPIHTTSFTATNNMVNSDNKGFAEYLVENKYRENNLVAAFFQTESGDVSPNMDDDLDTEKFIKTFISTENREFFKGHGVDFVDSAEIMGRKQAEVVLKHLDSPTSKSEIELDGNDIGSRMEYIDFNSYTTKSGDKTCIGMVGAGMLSGTEDGRGIPFLHEGYNQAAIESSQVDALLTSLVEYFATAVNFNPYFHPSKRTLRGVGDYIWNTLIKFDHTKFLNITQKEVDDIKQCHSPKVPGMWTGIGDIPLVPHLVPMQLIKIGSLMLPSVPYEVTSMSGERIRKDLQKQHDGVVVEVMALCNSYGAYLTTEEEYNEQNYEGASTHYGPKQLDAVRDVLLKLGSSLVSAGKYGLSKLTTDDRSFSSLTHQSLSHSKPHNPWLDTFFPPGNPISFSNVPGKSVTAEFYCNHPQNTQAEVTSFCDIEKLINGTYVKILGDEDWYTRFWYRTRYLFTEVCTCEWIPQEGQYEANGDYRIKMNGAGFSGTTDTFKVHAGEHEYSLESYVVYTRETTMAIVTMMGLCVLIRARLS